jgi:peptide/nickel transport system permease protein
VSTTDRPLADPKEAADAPDTAGPIDLARRKGWRPASVRHSLTEVRLEAAPFVTMARIALAQLARDRLARLGALLLASLVVVAVFADLLASSRPLACRWHGTLYVLPDVTQPVALANVDCAAMKAAEDPGDWLVEPLVAHGPTAAEGAALLPPLAPGHPLGTDALGRDVFARLVHGARTALGLGMVASLILVVIGVTLGALAGFAGGLLDALVSRTIEALMAIPTLVLVLVVCALVPHPTTATLLWTIALTRWTELARLVRAEVLLVLGHDYVTAARALGATPTRVLRRHVLPNAVGPAIVAITFGVASVVLVEAAVDFLGVAPPDTMASWGEALGEARANASAWWLIVFPGTALLATLVALNLVGEAARDALDPKLRGAGEGLAEGMRV